MTLVPFSPESLDRLALRLFDLAAIVRHMANSSRENEPPGFQLHVSKLNEWADQDAALGPGFVGPAGNGRDSPAGRASRAIDHDGRS